MQTIAEALAEPRHPTLCVEVNVREYVDLVDSVKTEPTTQVGKAQLAGAHKSADTLRGTGGKCCPTYGQLKMLVDQAAPAAVRSANVPEKPQPTERPDPRGSK